VLLLVIVLLLLLLAFVYYVLMVQGAEKRSQRQRLQPQIPVVKTEAASETLRAVRQQVGQIQDEVTRQALLSRSREIEANLSRGELQLVVLVLVQLAKPL
jgi:flagellar basal body-associated protein FliL